MVKEPGTQRKKRQEVYKSKTRRDDNMRGATNRVCVCACVFLSLSLFYFVCVSL